MMGGYDTYRSTRFFASLDGVRCLSILAVIWHHCGWNKAPEGWAVLSTGYLGVDLFFVISGFLITTLLLRERQDTGRISLRDFYIRRTLRIFPLYYTVIGLYVLTVFVFGCSLATEEQFYLLWPTIEKALKGMAIPAIIGTVLLVRTIVERTAPEAGLWASVILSIHPAILC